MKRIFKSIHLEPQIDFQLPHTFLPKIKTKPLFRQNAGLFIIHSPILAKRQLVNFGFSFDFVKTLNDFNKQFDECIYTHKYILVNNDTKSLTKMLSVRHGVLAKRIVDMSAFSDVYLQGFINVTSNTLLDELHREVQYELSEHDVDFYQM